MIGPFTIRPAVADDADTLVALTVALAAYHGSAAAATLTAEDVRRDGFGDRPLVWFWLATDAAGSAVGYVQLCQGYAAWIGRPILMVNNLYVDERLRGSGLGRRLLATVAAHALATGIPRIELHVVETNTARHFYEAVGFRILPDLRCRIGDEALARLAACA